MGSRADPIDGVDVILTKPDGSTETQTTEADGKFSFTVTEPGDYLVGVDPDTLPKGSELRRRRARPRGPDGALKVDGVELGKSYGATLTVRAADFDDSTSKWEEFLQSSVNGIRLGLLLALASVGLSPDLRHHRDLELRARRAGDPRRHARLLPDQRARDRASWLGGVLVVILCALQRLVPGPHPVATATTARAGPDPADDRDDRPLAGAPVHLPVHRRRPHRPRRRGNADGPRLRLGPDHQPVAGRRWGSRSWCWPWSATRSCAPASAGPPARSPTTRRWPQASGIDTDKVIRLVWTMAMALAGLSGLLYALVVNGIKWDTGLQILLLLFAAVTLGGLGTAFGALVGSLVIGLVVELSPLVDPG